MARYRSSAWPLAAACVCLIVYASLHPFSGWAWPAAAQDVSWWRLPVPQPRWVTRFDVVSNLIAYVPLGALLATGLVRGGRSKRRAFAGAVLAASALSYGLETLQHLLPQRVPSIIDWLLNTGGATLGAAALLGVHALGGLERWQRWRERWLLRDRGNGLTLLLLWPFGLLFPPPVPFGLGQVLVRARDAVAELLTGTAWDGWLQPGAPTTTPLAPGVELLGIAASLLAPVLVAYSLMAPGLRRLMPLLGALGLGVLVTTLSTALNFGPEHALTWVTAPAIPAILTAAVLALLLAWLPARSTAAVGLLVISLAVALVNAAPADAYYAASLQGWEQGRFVRLHGLAQWIGWCWPYAALAYLMSRVASRRAEGEP